MTEYAERDIMALDVAGEFYTRHISAMTGEKLHFKSDIAAELAWRDYLLSQQSQAEQTLEEFEATKPMGPMFVFAKYKGRWVDAVVGHRGGSYTYIFLGSDNHVLMSECITHVVVPRKPL